MAGAGFRQASAMEVSAKQVDEGDTPREVDQMLKGLGFRREET
jgi:hypothetical protein